MSHIETIENKGVNHTEQCSDRGRLISVVVPCFNESKVIDVFYQELKRVLRTLEGFEYEIIFVDDGSTDATLVQLNQIAHNDLCVRVGSLSRNFGHQIALTAGIDAAEGEAMITIDADLQHPPELIPQMIYKWKEGYDIVSAVRDGTEEVSYFKRITSRGFYYVLHILSEIPIPKNVADFNLFSRRAYMVLRNMPERHRFLRGMTSWIGFDRAFLSYAAGNRAAGQSKYTMFKMINLAIDGIFSFSSVPLRTASKLGIVITFSGFAYLMWILGRYLLLGDTVSGWASSISVTLILGGCNLSFVGLLGQYLSKVFEETKRRPLYIFKQIPTRFVQSQSQKGPKERLFLSKSVASINQNEQSNLHPLDSTSDTLQTD